MTAIQRPPVISRPGVTITRNEDGSVHLCLSDLAARRLMLGLGVNTRRYGPEVSNLLNGLCRLLIGVNSTAIETHTPHGRACPCPHCKEVFRHGRSN